MVETINAPSTPKVNQTTRGTRTDIRPREIEPVAAAEEKARQKLDAKKQACAAKGWFWDDATNTCVQDMPPQKIDLSTITGSSTEETPQSKTDRNINFNPDGTVTVAGANKKPVTLTKEEYDVYLGKPGELTENVKQAQAQPNIQEFQAEQAGQQLGQFGELPIEPTGLDVGEAATTGIVQNIPKALSYAAAAGIVTGAGTNPVSWAAASAVFVGTLAGGIISSFKSQRTDTTTAQQRVLDEGKQNLNDWTTLAAVDPANSRLYVEKFNQQLALIDQAYRKMKLDTSRDVAKFETALPNLAEFETFYNLQGEKDFLVARMRQALGVQQDPEYIYQLMELAQRRSK